MIRSLVPCIVPIPVRRRRLGIDSRTAVRLRRRHQSFVVFLGRLIWIWAHNLLTRIIFAAVAPRSRCRWFIANTVRGPDIGELTGRIASEIALVGPQFLILIEVFRQKQIQWQSLHSRGWPWEGRRSPPPEAAASDLLALPLLSAPCRLRRRLLSKNCCRYWRSRNIQASASRTKK